jgi:hypothetical protein
MAIPTAAERIAQAPFSLTGSPALAEARRRYAVRNARNQRRRGSVLASLVNTGGNPYLEQSALLNNERDTNQGVSDYLNNSQFQEQQGNLDFLRSLYGQERGYEEQRGAEDRARREARRNMIPSLLGGLVGQGAGGFVGGYGSRLGERLGAGRQRQPYYSGGGDISGYGGFDRYRYLDPENPWGGGYDTRG